MLNWKCKNWGKRFSLKSLRSLASSQVFNLVTPEMTSQLLLIFSRGTQEIESSAFLYMAEDGSALLIPEEDVAYIRHHEHFIMLLSHWQINTSVIYFSNLFTNSLRVNFSFAIWINARNILCSCKCKLSPTKFLHKLPCNFKLNLKLHVGLYFPSAWSGDFIQLKN